MMGKPIRVQSLWVQNGTPQRHKGSKGLVEAYQSGTEKGEDAIQIRTWVPGPLGGPSVNINIYLTPADAKRLRRQIKEALRS